MKASLRSPKSQKKSLLYSCFYKHCLRSDIHYIKNYYKKFFLKFGCVSLIALGRPGNDMFCANSIVRYTRHL